jgi:hypothetical protein
MDRDLITVIVSVSSLVVSFAAFTIAYSQFKIASAKAKLDLYNKRFNIYVTALDLFQATWYETHGIIHDKQIEFTKSYRESRFLFDKCDGVYETLGKIQQNAAMIYSYEEKKSDIENGKSNDRDSLSALHNASVKARDEFMINLETLEEQIEKYIQFKNINGWSLI